MGSSFGLYCNLILKFAHGSGGELKYVIQASVAASRPTPFTTHSTTAMNDRNLQRGAEGKLQVSVFADTSAAVRSLLVVGQTNERCDCTMDGCNKQLTTSNKQQATSSKQQATNNKQQATRSKQQATQSNELTNSGRWTLDVGHWTLDVGWTLDDGRGVQCCWLLAAVVGSLTSARPSVVS